MQIETVLTATLQGWRRSRFVWGASDCLMSVADYVVALGFADPATEWRGAIQNEADAMAVLAEQGGGLAILARTMPAVGLAPIGTPARGDVICAQIGPSQIGGLCLGDFSAFRTERGMMRTRTSSLEILGAWRP